MRRVLLAAAAVLVTCVVVAGADKLSEAAKKKIAAIETDLRRSVRKEPLTFHELCVIKGARFEGLKRDKEVDPVRSLRIVRDGLQWRIRRLNPYWEPKRKPQEPEKKVKRVYKQYDITDIVSLPPDRYAPTIGFGMGYFLQGSTTRRLVGGIVDLSDESYSDSGAGFDWEKIAELIERFLPEDSEGEFRYCGGRLTCYVAPEVVPVIEGLLAKMRKCSGYSINLDVKFIRVTAAYMTELRKKGGESAIYLSDEAQKKLLSDAKAKKGVEIVASSEVMASDAQVVHVREGQQVSLLMDYDVSGGGAQVLTPVVRVINEGLICQFRPKVLFDGRMIDISVLASLSRLNKDMRKTQFMGGEIMLPSMKMSRLRTNVLVPNGQAVLVGGTAELSEGKEDGPRFVVFVKPTLNRR